MDPLTVIGVVASVVQLVDFGSRLISKSAKIYTGATPLIGAPAIEAAAADVKLLKAKLQDDAKSTHDEGMERLCQACEDVANRLLSALKKISVDGKQQIWSSMRKALKTIMTKTQIQDLDRVLSSIRQELNLRITVDLRYVGKSRSISIWMSHSSATLGIRFATSVPRIQDVLTGSTQLRRRS